MIPNRWKTSVPNVKTLPGADCGSDHQLLSATITVRLKKLKRERPIIRYDVSSISDEYKVEISNKFMALYNNSEEKSPTELADDIRDVFHESAANHLSEESEGHNRGLVKRPCS